MSNVRSRSAWSNRACDDALHCSSVKFHCVGEAISRVRQGVKRPHFWDE